ncbi:MAG: glycosyl hydrolase family 28-related protein [Gemmatimonadetes bacterium]|nr:glycosyl hydrolase family 28-related protein [Gemmatimonadota bacterium]
MIRSILNLILSYRFWQLLKIQEIFLLEIMGLSSWALLGSLLVCNTALAEDIWRSKLYPLDWKPGHKDSNGNFLHDFSFAGYKRGEKEIPIFSKTMKVDVTEDVFGADPTGIKESTTGIQAAIDFVGKSGGGIVHIPVGVYRIKPAQDKAFTLKISYDNVILRGDGVDKTFLFNDEPYMRHRKVIFITPRGPSNWHSSTELSVDIVQDLTEPTTRIPLSDVSHFKENDQIVIISDATDSFLTEHDMLGYWSQDTLGGPIFYRQIVKIDSEVKIVEIDIPTRYYLLRRDHARIYKIDSYIEGVGIENLSIGMRENPKPNISSFDWYFRDTAGYEVHNSHVIFIRNAIDCWVQKVNTFRPKGNQRKYHILSHGIKITASRNITIRNCDFRYPQYKGRNGNGYLYSISGSDCLIQNCIAVGGRHNFSFSGIQATGNVIHRCVSKHGQLPSDFHRNLSIANLIDNMTLKKDWLEARYRLGSLSGLLNSKVHGHPTTQSVFWNTRGIAYHPQSGSVIIDSRQVGQGYIIGTQGLCHKITLRPLTIWLKLTQYLFSRNTAPDDFVEGVGTGNLLSPESLYEDQLDKRLRSVRELN